jgi:DNA-binding beta-propeller fold protein YncE
VSSFGDANTESGFVARIDTTSLTVKDRCSVGYEPEEMVVRDNKLYVANSGGYHWPDYDNTVSVIDLNQFKETKKITVAVNLQRMLSDNHNNIYVTSNGDYGDIQPDTYIIGTDDAVKGSLNLPASAMALCGDSMFICSNAWSNEAGSFVVSYAVVDTKIQSIVSRNFITDGTDTEIIAPYGIAVNPETKDILLTDTKDRTVPGTVYCFTAGGKKKWSYVTGDIPAYIVFTQKKLKDL